MLLLHGDGANGGNNFPDNSGRNHNMTVGGTVITSTSAIKFGSASMYFNGGSYIYPEGNTDFNFGTGDFTVDCWVNLPSIPATMTVMCFGTLTTDPTILLASNGAVYYQTQGVNAIISAAGAVVVNTWTHLALVRSSGVTKLYINGVSAGSYADSGNYANSANRPLIGGYPSYFLTGYIDEFRISNVARWTANFTPPTSAYSLAPVALTATALAPSSPVLGGGTAWAAGPALGLPALKINDGNTILLLHGDGSKDKTFSDATSRHAVTPDGAAAVSTAQHKFGASSVALSGPGGIVGVGGLYLDGGSDFAFGTGDFTIDFWFYLKAAPTTAYVLYDGRAVGAIVPVIYSGGNSPLIYFTNNANQITGTTTPTLNAWHHAAVVRASGVTKLYLDGVQEGASYTDANSYVSGAAPSPCLGAAFNASSPINGYLDEFRVSKGLARWTANFTPPAAAYTPDANTSLLLHFEDAITTTTSFPDTSGRNHVVTPAGTAQTVGSPAKLGGAAMAFNGADTTYLTLDGSSDFAFGTGDFTIDFWFYLNAVSTLNFYDGRGTPTTNVAPLVSINSSSVLSTNLMVGVTIITANVWHHAAIVRCAGTASLYLDGNLESSVANSQNYIAPAAAPVIGGSTGVAARGVNGYIDELRVSKVARWTTAFTPPTAPYPPYSLTPVSLAPASPYFGPAWPIQAIDASTVLLLHCDGFNGSTTIPDTSGRNHLTISNGNAKLATAQERFGSASMFFDGNVATSLTLDGASDFAFGTGDFTIDLWMFPTAVGAGNPFIYDPRPAGTQTGPYLCFFVTTGPPNVIQVTNASGLSIVGTIPVSINAWTHVAVSRAGTTLRLFVNGVLDGTATDSSAFTVGASRPVFGQNGYNPGNSLFTGYMDEVRVSKGVARWPANFNVPLAPWQYFFPTGSSLTTASPALGAPGVSSGMGALSLVTSSPVLGTPAFTHFFALTALDLVTGSPVLGLGYQIGVLAANGLITGSPDVPVDPILQQRPQILYATDLVTGSPVLGTPSRIPTPPPVYPDDMDRHVRRSGDDYAKALIDLLPQGQAWPRDPESTLIRSLVGLAQYYGFVDSRAADLLERESDPRTTIELLPDWERNWGLPDPCFKETHTIREREDMLVMKMTLLGGQSRDFFYSVAQWMGYSLTIREYSPFMAGISSVGDTRWLDDGVHYRWEIGPPEMRYYWTINVTQASLTWFRASQGQAGVDPHLRIGRFIDQNCLLERWKPAHTQIVYSYSNLKPGDSMEGTP